MSNVQWQSAQSIPANWREAWSSLARTQSPLADVEWLRCFSAAFGDPKWQPTIHFLHRGSELVAGIPLVHEAGMSRVWTSYENEHFPYWQIVGQLDATSAELLLTGLLDDGYLFLRRLHVESATCTAIREAADRMGLHVSLIQSATGDARTVVRGTWEDFRSQLPKEYRQNLPRVRRQLERHGRLELHSNTEPGPALEAALHECFELETRGWKGESGMPILRDPRTLSFYSELATSLATTQRFELFTLRYERKVIAFQYCLRGGGHIELLKESYDPAHASRGPSHLLRMMVLEELFARGEPATYHMGRATVGGDPAREWKLQWATEVAPLCTLRIYSGGLRGQMAYVTGPVLRGRLRRSRLVAAVRARWYQLRRGLASLFAREGR
jgi:CelD/BcsL family acetyltransferase involved in cellulose biosynthesis